MSDEPPSADASSGVEERFNDPQAPLVVRGFDPDPIAQFRQWFDVAREADLVEPAAMALGTVDAQGHPQVRMVLLREVRPTGFVFFTNYESAKGTELRAHPHAALSFHWDRLERQVRIVGVATPISPEESDRYFESRPRASQIAAIASPQSQVISTRATLDHLYADAAAIAGESAPIPRPSSWGGFLVRPHTMEFWQGRRHRLHDRVRYRAGDQEWRIERLAP